MFSFFSGKHILIMGFLESDQLLFFFQKLCPKFFAKQDGTLFVWYLELWSKLTKKRGTRTWYNINDSWGIKILCFLSKKASPKVASKWRVPNSPLLGPQWFKWLFYLMLIIWKILTPRPVRRALISYHPKDRFLRTSELLWRFPLVFVALIT